MALIFASPIPARILSSFLQNMLLFTHTCPVTEFAVASHLNTANSCCHHVFLRHFRFQKYLPVYSNQNIPIHVSGSQNRVYDTDALFPYAFSVSKMPGANSHYKTLIVCSGVTKYAIFLSCFSVSNAGNNWNS